MDRASQEQVETDPALSPEDLAADDGAGSPWSGEDGPHRRRLPFRLPDLVIVAVAFAVDLVFTGYLAVDLMGTGFFTGDLVTLHDRTAAPPLAAVGLVGAMAVSLLARWRHGLAVFLFVLTMTSALGLWLLEARPFLCLLVAMYAAARQTGRQTALVVLALALVGMVLRVLVVVRSSPEPDPSAWGYLIPGIAFSALVLGVWVVARREQAAARRADTLTVQLDRRAELASRDERERIARDLHDILAHSVSAMMMQAAGARAMAQSLGRDLPEDHRVQSVQDALSTIETTGSQSMRELHRLLGTSVSSSLEADPDASGSSEPPSLADLDGLLATSRDSGLIVELHRSGTVGELDPSVGVAAYRTVQESLTNALKHAGRGAVVDVYESWNDVTVRVQVRCRGSHGAIGPQAPSGGFGLRGLRERVALAGGVFEAGWVGEEFVTSAVLPQSGARSGARPEET